MWFDMRAEELKLIIENLANGRWTIPVSPFLLKETFDSERSAYWEKIFQGFQDNQFNSSQAIFALSEIEKQLLVSKANKTANFELVWTGPEALNSTLRDTAIAVQELFRQAKGEVVIAGFAFYQGKELFKELGQKMDSDPNFKVTFFVDVRRDGNTSIDAAVLLKFKTDFQKKQWPANRFPEIYYDPRTLALDGAVKSSMHAKCIIVDAEKTLVTSANFTQAAHHRNIEAGVVLHSKEYAVSLKSQFFNLVEAGLLKKI
jgi:phosphatidylserine/phosphatidylglycerophosphate/cardiolipin synthase-like enzyme